MLFNSFDGFANHLRTRVIPAIRSAAEESLKPMGDEAKKEAVDQIGHYQSGIGNFGPWAPLAESTIEKKSRGYAGFATNYHRGLDGNADSPMYDTGAFRDDIETVVDERHLLVRVKTTKEYIAFTELGTADMPARPVFGPAGIRSMPHNVTYFKGKLITKIRATM